MKYLLYEGSREGLNDGIPLWVFSRLAGPLWNDSHPFEYYPVAGSAAILCTREPDVIRKEAWPFYRTSSGVRICWELEESKGPEGDNSGGVILQYYGRSFLERGHFTTRSFTTSRQRGASFGWCGLRGHAGGVF